jgi:predicted nuclease of predicted toxin-antitoxin system
VRLWIHECLSPTLVDLAQRRYEATCNEYRGLLRAKDPALYAVISQQEWVLVTNNDRDFRALTMRAGLHSGLIVLPQRARSDQP